MNDIYDELNLCDISKEHSETLAKIKKMNNKFMLEEKREENLIESKNRIIEKIPLHKVVDQKLNLINVDREKTQIIIDNCDQFGVSSISNTKDDYQTNKLKNNQELVIPINSKQTNIHKLLKVSEKDIRINRSSLSYLNESKIFF